MLDSFHSPSGDLFSLREVVEEMLSFMGSEPARSYRVIIGSDSQEYKNGAAGTGDTDFVSVVVVHRVGRGGRYFWLKNRLSRILPLREKIYEEATRSLMLAMELGGELKGKLGQLGATDRTEPESSVAGASSSAPPLRAVATSRQEGPSYILEIHVDIGTQGPTRDMIREIVGMIRGSGFVVRTKPEAYAASTVADRYT